MLQNERHEKILAKLQQNGAVSINRDMSSVETDVAQRTLINIREKDIIAEYAASMINDNDFVYIDAGTTTEKMIDYLDKKVLHM